jgi:hypothetical protein
MHRVTGQKPHHEQLTHVVILTSIIACHGNCPNSASVPPATLLPLNLDVRSCRCYARNFSLEYGSQVGQSEREKLPEEETMEQTKIANKDLEFAILGQCLRYFVFLH